MSEDSNGAARAGSNSGDPKEMASFVIRIENLNAEKASIMGAAKQQCGVLQKDIKEVEKEAKAAGIPVKSVRSAIQIRSLEHKIEEVKEGLEDDQLFYLDQIFAGLGQLAGTPLGEAAMERAEAEASA